MRQPGFNAEVSLYRTTASYRIVGATAPHDPGPHVLGSVGAIPFEFGTARPIPSADRLEPSGVRTVDNWFAQQIVLPNVPPAPAVSTNLALDLAPQPVPPSLSRPGLRLCNGVPVDVTTNPAHCGNCNQPCNANRICCNSQCVPVQSQNNCGGCGISCGQFQGCCPIPGGNFACANLQTNPANCGFCGNRCPTGCCVTGQCHTLQQLASDPQNCGICNRNCAPSEVCSNGQCCPACHGWYEAGGTIGRVKGRCYSCDEINAFQTRCAGVDCTAAGVNCLLSFNPASIQCITFYGCCINRPIITTCCNGICSNLCTDPQSCGTCGNHCAPGSCCLRGVCTPTSFGTNPFNCGGCQIETRNGLRPGAQCLPGQQACCWGQCVNLDDRNNCGSCGHQCSPGQCCINRSCFDIDFQNDPANCGGCGRKCPAGWACCAGNCVNVDLWNDPNNCGNCGKRCPESFWCKLGECVPLIL